MIKPIPMAVALLALASLPLFGVPDYVLHLFITTLLTAVAGTGWAMMGRFGLVSFGHGAFFGAGAYTTALLWNHLGVSPWLGIPVGIMVAVGLGAALGWPCFRLRVVGHYFGLVTLAAGEIVRLAITAMRDQTGGSLGMTPDRAPEHAFAAMQFSKAGFWWLALGYFGGLYSWYAVQVHQTKYLVEVGFTASDAALALGAVSLAGVPGQIALGQLSDRIGREFVWAVGALGFILTYTALLMLEGRPNFTLMVAMVLAQGLLGYGLTSVMGAIPAEIFEGRHYGSIFGTLMLFAITGGSAAPWITGLIHDATHSYALAFKIAIGVSVVSAISIWRAAPGKVRAVAGKIK